MAFKLLGPGVLYRAPVGTANPDESTVAWGTAWGGSWTDMGDFPEGSPITISNPEEIYKAYSERSTVVQAISRTRREPVLKGSLFDHTPANLAVLLDAESATTEAAGGGQKGYTEISIDDQAEVTLYKWGIEARLVDDDNNEQPIRWFFHKGFIRMTGDLAYAKTKETAIPFEITIVGDSTQSGNKIGKLQIVTENATAST